MQKSSRRKPRASLILKAGKKFVRRENPVLPRTERSIRAQCAGTKPQPRSKGRWNAMERRSAIRAKFGVHLIRPQPCSACHAFGVNTLHSPSGKILHASLQNFSELSGVTKSPLGKVGRILRQSSCCVKKKTTISSRCVAKPETTVLQYLNKGEDSRVIGSLIYCQGFRPDGFSRRNRELSDL
jgi:hypothetical protein